MHRVCQGIYYTVEGFLSGHDGQTTNIHLMIFITRGYLMSAVRYDIYWC
jgi:hypothetical protein